MPHPDHRPPYQIHGDLNAMRVWEVIETRRRVKISCDSCHHEATWTPQFMEKRLKRQTAWTMVRLAGRLRCAGCRSNYLRMWTG